jgi:hypothetical protein
LFKQRVNQVEGEEIKPVLLFGEAGEGGEDVNLFR